MTIRVLFLHFFGRGGPVMPGAGLIFRVIEFVDNVRDPVILFFGTVIKTVGSIREGTEIGARTIFERDVVVERQGVVVCQIINGQVFSAQMIAQGVDRVADARSGASFFGTNDAEVIME